MRRSNLKHTSVLYLLIFTLLLFSVPRQLFAAIAVPNDPLFSEQWYLSKIQAVGAWEKTTGSPEVVVAVLDTGVDLDHPDIAGRIWKNSREHENGKDDDGNGFIDDIDGWDFIDNDNDPNPDTTSEHLTRTGVNHGTILAGVIGGIAGNDEGVTGVNWRVRIMPIRVLDSEGVGNTQTVERGIRYAVANGADVINLSFVGKTFQESFYNVVFDAWKKGVVVVTAAGNGGDTSANLDETPFYPACFAGPAGENIILGVSAADREDKLAKFSNFGKKCTDIVAPGVGIFSTQVVVPGNTIFHDRYGGGWSGTSVAAAITSGVAALIKAYNRDLDAQEIIRIITDNSENIDRANGSALGRGRLNAFLALQATEEYILGQGRGLIQKGKIIVGPGSVGRAQPVRIFEPGGRWVTNIVPYGNTFKGEVRVAAGDINNDGFPEVATVPGSGEAPHVRVWQSNGRATSDFFAYEKSFTGGAQIAFANLDGSGSEQLITAPGAGRESEIRIWKYDGTLFNKFLAFPESYAGGVVLGVADFDRNGEDEIIVAPQGNFDPVIKIFRPDGVLISSFSVLPKQDKKGVNFAVGDLNGDGWTEIITTAKGGPPLVRIWNYLGKELRPSVLLGPRALRGIHLEAGDLDFDGKDEVVIGAPRGYQPTVRVYDANFRLKTEFLAYPKNERNGVNVAVVK